MKLFVCLFERYMIVTSDNWSSEEHHRSGIGCHGHFYNDWHLWMNNGHTRNASLERRITFSENYILLMRILMRKNKKRRLLVLSITYIILTHNPK